MTRYVPVAERIWFRWDDPYIGTLPPFKVVERKSKKVFYQYQGLETVFEMSAKLFGQQDFRLVAVPVVE